MNRKLVVESATQPMTLVGEELLNLSEHLNSQLLVLLGSQELLYVNSRFCKKGTRPKWRLLRKKTFTKTLKQKYCIDLIIDVKVFLQMKYINKQHYLCFTGGGVLVNQIITRTVRDVLKYAVHTISMILIARRPSIIFVNLIKV